MINHFWRNVSEFHKTFKVGDLIVGFSTGVPLEITAIGETRFLFKHATHERREERVATIGSYQRAWRFWDPYNKRLPDGQYLYIMETTRYMRIDGHFCRSFTSQTDRQHSTSIHPDQSDE